MENMRGATEHSSPLRASGSLHLINSKRCQHCWLIVFTLGTCIHLLMMTVHSEDDNDGRGRVDDKLCHKFQPCAE
eukprot:529239-Amphidinium_carterae.1